MAEFVTVGVGSFGSIFHAKQNTIKLINMKQTKLKQKIT
jgi:hypothetical protein